MSKYGIFRSRLCVIWLVTVMTAAVSRNGVKVLDMIIGGSDANLQDYPFMVSVQSFRSNWEHSCGGAIVSPKMVLTACHCVYTQRYPMRLRHPSYTRVVAGQGNLEIKTKHRQIKPALRFVPHPDCGSPDREAENWHDVAAVVLRKKFRYNPLVQPVSVFSKDPKEAAAELKRLQELGTVCDSPGWGLNRTNPDTISPRLKVAMKTLLTTKTCKSALCQIGKSLCVDFEKFDQICAAGLDSSVCKGDSGGPLICNGFLFGVVSYGPRCGIRIPQVYSSVVPILDFINSVD